ncbi:MAG: phage holin family protein [Egibacteraceae bacterium]
MNDLRAQRSLPASTDLRNERARKLFGPRPDVGVGPAAKAVADDLKALVEAEVALAKAELTASLRAKATGAGLLAGAGVMGWLAIQGLLITIALALALVLPGWAAVLIVTAVLLLGAGGAALAGRSVLKRSGAPLDTTKTNVKEDVTWIKSHVSRR